MHQCSLEEIQDCLLGILRYVDSLFIKYNINYSLAYGTLIGAARHGGFIPWDDDLDIVMSYKNYVKMLQIPELNNLNNRYTLHTRRNYKNYGYPFAKIEDNETKCVFFNTTDKGGAFMDVFPMTHLPVRNRAKYENKLKHIHDKLAFTNSVSQNSLKNLVHILTRPLRAHYRDLLIKEALEPEYENSGWLTDSTWSDHRLSQAVPESWFSDYTYLDFEDQKFKVISHYDEWLKEIYGNWRELPPKEKRIPHHNFYLYKI